MNTERLRVAVVGVGNLGKHHARIYSQIPDIELAGVVDIDARTAAKVASRLGTSAYARLSDIPGRIDGVSVVVPTDVHLPVAREAFALGAHVLIEKPIALNVAEANEIIERAREKGLVLQVGHIERFNPAILALRKILTRVGFIEVHRLAPYKAEGTEVGVVLDLMIHDIDIILNIVHSPIKDIRAVGIPVLSSSEDIANARIQFENGCIANVTASRISFEKVRKIRIFQSNAYISLDYQNQEGMIYRKEAGRIIREKMPLEKDEPLKLEIKSFLECIRASRQPVVPGEHGRHALRVASEITRLLHENSLYRDAIEEQRNSPPLDLRKLM
ncbi:MAG: Gfo/Idh/MocA family oxidoreductase [Candidatus Aureabacteria bacterium]|nr:Gfo/Idh/MocA family oxidoreductase [Candidatus Auribacterota bacterium]